jgi:hypothetical protein
LIDSIYAAPGAIVLVEWLLAAVLYVVGWYQSKYGLRRVSDGLALAGLVTALASVGWLAWDVSPKLALARSSLATGLAVSALAVYAVLAHRRTERLSAFGMLGFAIPMQAYAVGRLWWGVEVVPSGIFLPLWVTLRTLTGLVGYGALIVAATVIILSFALSRARGQLSADQLTAAAGLSTLEWRSWRIALIALSVSLSMELIRSWWGLGQVMAGGFVWALVTWLLLVAGAYGLAQGALRRRPARVLLVLAGAIAIVAAVMMGGPLAGTDPLMGTGPLIGAG